MKYTVIVETGQNGLKLDKKMIGKKSSYMVNSINHILLAPKSTIERIDVATVLEDGYGVYYYRMKGSMLSYLFAKRDFGRCAVYKNIFSRES